MDLLTRELYASDVLITGPALEPIDLDETKRHLRITTTSEDTLLDTYIAMARQYFEEATGRQLIAATWERRLSAFLYGSLVSPYYPSLIELPHPPLIDIVSLTYTDGDGGDVTLEEVTDYVVDASSGAYARRGLVRPIAGGSWPTARGDLGSARIRYRAGYGTHPGDVPELIKGALYFLVGHFYKFRAEVQEGTALQQVPIGAESIIRAFKYSALPTQPPLRTTWWG